MYTKTNKIYVYIVNPACSFPDDLLFSKLHTLTLNKHEKHSPHFPILEKKTSEILLKYLIHLQMLALCHL